MRIAVLSRCVLSGIVMAVSVFYSLSLLGAAPPPPELVGHRTVAGVWTSLRLSRIPTSEERKLLSASGIDLHDFMGGTTYWALVREGSLGRLRRSGVRGAEVGYVVSGKGEGALSVFPVVVRAEERMGAGVAEGDVPDWALRADGRWLLELSYRRGIQPQEVEQAIGAAGATISHHAAEFRYVSIIGDRASARALAEQVWVSVISFVGPPQELYVSPSVEGGYSPDVLR